MGYSERYCHICGVSFNIGRIRTKNEPRSHAWREFRSRDNRLFVDGGRNSHIGECKRGSGCMLAFREDIAAELETQQRKHDKFDGARGDGDCSLMNEHEDRDDVDDESDDDFVPDRTIIEIIQIEDEFGSRIEDASTLGTLTSSNPTVLATASNTSREDLSMNHGESADDGIIGNLHVVEVMDYEYETPTDTCSEYEDETCEQRMTSDSDSDDEAEAQYRDFQENLKHKERPKSIRDEEEVLLPLFRPLDGRDGDVASTHGSDASFECDEVEESHEWRGRKLDHWISGKLSHYNHPFSKKYSRYVRDSIWEHIAGPGCLNTSGYHGTRISEQEMQFANTLQCLVRKTNASFGNGKNEPSAMLDWQPEWDDEPWEEESSWVLSGISDYMPSRDCDDPQVFPARHGHQRLNAENVCWSSVINDSEQYTMPFHPSCLEIYKRVSIKRHGSFDVDILGSWWQLKSRYDEFHAFPRSDAVKRGERQWWQHNPGDEHLAADPLWPPGLAGAIAAARNEQARAMNNKPISSRWASLPLEVTMHILSHLAVVEVAKTSLAIPETRSVAKQMIQRRLQVRYPSLWELSSTQSYYKWVGLTAERLKTRQKEFDRKEAEFQQVCKVLAEEGHDNACDQLKQYWEAHIAANKNEIFASVMSEKSPLCVPTSEVGVAGFVIALHEAEVIGNLNGLRNRERIWKDCETILDQIEVLQEQGEILPNGQLRSGVQLFDH